MAQIVDASVMGAVAVTVSDTVDILFPSGINRTRGIYVGVTGDLNVVMASGELVLLKSAAAGIVHPISAKRVYATDTTATDIVAMY